MTKAGEREQGDAGMRKTVRWERYCVAAALALLILIGFAAHRSVPFMTDDNWYAKNLVTDAPLESLWDVLESQAWHFMNWGGRCVTHALLQLTLMAGELWADILNLVMTLLLTFLVCRIAERRSFPAFLLAHSMIYALNANLQSGMLWQAGAVNYIYSSTWILLFMLPYLRVLRDPGGKPAALAAFWLAPVGLMAGWSNENMGPVCFLLALGTMIWSAKWQKQRPKLWMIVGMVSSFIGSVLVVAAPGNFVRSAEVPPQTIFDRFVSMLTAGTDYLLPSALLTVTLVLIKTICLHSGLDRVQWALVIMAVLSYGAMVLSPHYPDRATTGTMVLCIALSLSVTGELMEAAKERQRGAGYVVGMAACLWFCAAGRLVAEIFYI